MAKKKSNAGNAYILSQLNSYKGFSMPKVNVKAKPKADASKKKVEPKKKVETKKSGPSMYDTKVRDQYGKPVVNKPSDSKKKPYGMASKTSDKKKVVKKVEAKKTSPKKSTGFVDAVNDWVDRNFRTAINKSVPNLKKKIKKKAEPIRKEAQKTNTKSDSPSPAPSAHHCRPSHPSTNAPDPAASHEARPSSLCPGTPAPPLPPVVQCHPASCHGAEREWVAVQSAPL